MTTLLNSDQKILTTGPGQCVKCKNPVTRVLVDNGATRVWNTMDFDAVRNRYVTHQCPTEPESRRMAA